MLAGPSFERTVQRLANQALMTDLLNLAAVDNLPGRTIIGPTPLPRMPGICSGRTPVPDSPLIILTRGKRTWTRNRRLLCIGPFLEARVKQGLRIFCCDATLPLVPASRSARACC